MNSKSIIYKCLNAVNSLRRAEDARPRSPSPVRDEGGATISPDNDDPFAGLPVDIQSDGDDGLLITLKVNIDKKKYVSLSHPEWTQEQDEANLEEEDGIDARGGISSVEDSALAQDREAQEVARARQECATSVENCRARNKLACPYHGAQIIKLDVLQCLQNCGLDGIEPSVEADTDHRGHMTGGWTIKVPCLNVREEKAKIAKALRAFLKMPGVDAQSVTDPKYNYVPDIDRPELDRHEVSQIKQTLEANGYEYSPQRGYNQYFDVESSTSNSPEERPARRERSTRRRNTGTSQPAQQTRSHPPKPPTHPPSQQQSIAEAAGAVGDLTTPQGRLEYRARRAHSPWAANFFRQMASNIRG